MGIDLDVFFIRKNRLKCLLIYLEGFGVGIIGVIKGRINSSFVCV